MSGLECRGVVRRGDANVTNLSGENEGMYVQPGTSCTSKESEHRGTDPQDDSKHQASERTCRYTGTESGNVDQDETGHSATHAVSPEPAPLSHLPKKIKSKRLRQKQCTPEEWVRHRKLRKKIASAKWYLKKKKAIIAVENDLRCRLEEEYQQRRQQPIWDPLNFAYWKCVTDHLYRGYPVRPEHVSPIDWTYATSLVEESLQRLKHENPWRGRMQWDHKKERMFRQLCLREVWSEYEYQAGGCTAIATALENQIGRMHMTQPWWNIVCHGQWPCLATPMGLVFVQLAVLGQTDRWIEFCNAVKQVATHMMDTSSHSPTRSPSMAMVIPIQTPNMNTLWDHPILRSYTDEWINVEDQYCNVAPLDMVDTDVYMDPILPPEPDSLDSLFLHHHYYTDDDLHEELDYYRYHDRNLDTGSHSSHSGTCSTQS